MFYYTIYLTFSIIKVFNQYKSITPHTKVGINYIHIDQQFKIYCYI